MKSSWRATGKGASTDVTLTTSNDEVELVVGDFVGIDVFTDRLSIDGKFIGTRDEVAQLVTMLQHWMEYGKLPRS